MAKKKETLDRGKALEALGLSQADFDALDANGKKAIDSLIRQFEKLQDISNQTKSVWDDLTNAVAGVKLNDFISSIEYSSEDIAKMVLDIHRLNDGIQDAASSLNAEWVRSLNKGESLIIDMIDRSTDLSSELATALKKAVSSGNIGDFLQEQGSIGEDALKKLIASTGWKSLNKFVTSDGLRGYQEMRQELVRINQQYDLQGKKVIDIGRGLDRMLANMTASFAPDKWVGALTDFDKIIHETQKNSGIMLADSLANEQQFTKLTTEAARFGLSVQDSADMMMRLGSGLRTTNLDVLHGAAMDMAAMSSATGLSIDEVGELSSQMMLFGKTAKQVSKFSQETMMSAYKYGVNGKKIMQDITKALPKVRELGWMGGADALKAMALQAERLGQNLDELVESSKKLRTLEGSLEASADLALMGLNIDPLQMLGAARRGGKEYSDMIAQLGAGIGTFNKQTGEMDFNPLDYDILKSRAEAVGMSVESLQKQLTKTAQDNQKIELLPPGLFNSLKPEEQAFLLDSMKLKDGQLVNFKVGNITDLSRLNKDIIKSAADKTAKDKESLEKQAQQNMHFRQSVDALKGSIMSIFTYLQPIIDAATSIVQGVSDWFGKLPTTLKIAFAAGVGALALIYSAGKQFLSGYFYGLGLNRAAMGGGFLNSLKTIFRNPFRGATPPPTTITTNAGGAGTLTNRIPTGNQAAGVSKLSEALRAMPSPAQLLALSVALVAFGAAIVGIGYGIKLASEGLSSLVTAFDGISNAGAALGAVAVVMGGFIGIIWAMVPAISALSTIGTAGVIGLLALGAAFVGIGYGINIAAKGIAEMVTSFSSLNGSVSAALGAMVSGMAIMGGFAAMMAFMAPVIGALGVASTAGAIGLLALGAAFIAIGYGINLASKGIAEMVTSFSSLNGSVSAALGAMVSGVAIMGGFVAMMALMIPVIGALGVAGTAGAIGLLTLGAAFMGIGFGIKLAGEGINMIINSFSNISGSLSSTLATMTAGIGVMAGFTGVAFAMAPAIIALGSAGTVGAVGLLALGAAFTGIGYGINLASQGLAQLALSFVNIKNSSGALLSITGVVAGMVGIMWLMPPVITAIGTSLGTLAVIGTAAIPVMLAFGGALALAGIGIKFAGEGIATITKSFSELFAAIINTAQSTTQLSSIALGVAALAPAMLAVGAAGLISMPGMVAAGIGFGALALSLKAVAPALEKLSTITLNNLSSIGSALLSIIPGISAFAGISLLTPLLIVGAAGLTVLAPALQSLSNSLNTLSSVNWSGLSMASQSLLGLLPGLAGFAGISILSGLILIGSGAVHALGLALSSLSNSAADITGVNWDSLKEMNSSIMSLIPGLMAFSTIGAISGLIAIAAGSLQLITNNLSSLKVADLPALSGFGNALANNVSGLFAFSTVGVISPLLLAAAGAFGAVGYALNSFKDINIDSLSGVGETLSSLTGSLLKFSSIAIVAPLLITGALGLTALGYALQVAGPAFSSLESVNWNIFSTIGSSIESAIPSLMSFSILGILAAPLIMGATAVATIGNLLGSSAKGFDIFSNVNLGGVKRVVDELPSMLNSMASMSVLDVLASPIIAGAGMLATAGMMLSIASEGFDTFSKINWDALGNATPVLASFSSSILKFSEIAASAGSLIAGAAALATSGIMLEVAAKGFQAISSVKWDGLSNMQAGINNLVPALSNLSNLTSLTAPVMIGAAMLSSIGSMFNSAATGFISLSQVKWSSFDNMGATLTEMAPGLKNFAEVGLLSGLITGTGTALMALGNGFKSLIGINFGSFDGLGQAVDSMTPSLEKFADLGFMSIPIHLASGALTTIGNAMSTVSGGIGKLTGINWESVKLAGMNLGNFIPNVAEFASMKVVAASATLSSLGNSLSNSAKGFSDVAGIDWSKVSAMGTSLESILPSLSSFGLKGMFAVPGISMMNSVLSKLSNTMNELSPALDMASKSLLSMSESLEATKIAMKGVDASGLSNLASISEKFVNSSANVQVAATTEQTSVPATVSGKLSVSPITVNVKINGRDLHQEIVEATAHLG